MHTRAFLTVAILGLLCSLPAQTVRASSSFITHYDIMETVASPNLTTDILKFNGMAVKRGEPYDEKKDPALRKGTENWEQPQGSFFAIPAFIIGLALAFLFFNRD